MFSTSIQAITVFDKERKMFPNIALLGGQDTKDKILDKAK